MRIAALSIIAVLVLGACGSSTSGRIAAANRPPPEAAPAWSPPAARQTADISPRIITPAKPLQCVPYTREQSGIPIRGDAWTWWSKAAGKYDRSNRPRVGSVIVFKRTDRNSYGHLAVVTRILNDREIVARHANWLNKGRIHMDTPIRDVSGNNDWSAVRVWYTPGNVYGRTTYPVSGFIHSTRQANR